MNRSRAKFERLWVRIGKRFVPMDNDATRIVNLRQERERSAAKKKYVKQSEGGRTTSAKRWGDQLSEQSVSDSLAIGKQPLPASDSDSDSDSGSSVKTKTSDSIEIARHSPSIGWEVYIGIFLAAGKPLNDRDLEKTLRIWLGMPTEAKLQATSDAEAMCRSASSHEHIKFPFNHLSDHPWTRKAPERVLPYDKPLSKSEQAHADATRRFKTESEGKS